MEPMMPSDKRNATRKQIIDAAFTCCAKYGYAKTTFDDIAKQAGISRALIYTYFKSKEEFFFTMVAEKHLSYRQQSKEVLDSNLSTREKLHKIIDIWIIDHHRLYTISPFPRIWLNQLKSIEKSHKIFKENFIASLEPILGHDLAEVVVQCYRGLVDDRPPVPLLEKRTEILLRSLKIPDETD